MGPLDGPVVLTHRLDARDIARGADLLKRAPEVLIEALRKANEKSSATLVQRIKRHKLTGDPLNRITGTLIRSWAAMVPAIREENGWLGGAGSNLEYADYHEFGFHGTVQVRAHERRAARTRTASGKFRKRAADAGTHSVRAHTRDVNYAGRPYARPALAECKDQIAAHHHDAIRTAMERLK